MAKLNVKIDPLSFVAIFLLIIFGWLEEVIFYLVALIIHEFSHYYVAKKLGYDFNNITFSPFGASLNGSKNNFKQKDEIIVALAGPIINLVIAILFIAIWWLFPSFYSFTYTFVIANFALFIFNMLPLFPLDAGRIIIVLLKNSRKKKFLFKIYIINSIIFAVLLMGLFVVSAFSKINLTYLFIAILLLYSIFDIKKDIYYQYAFMDKKTEYSKILPVKEYTIPSEIPIVKLLKFINKHTYSIFNFVDKSGNIILTLNEKQILERCINISTGEKFGRSKN